MPHRHRDFVARRAGYRCEYCLAPEILFNSSMEVEHIQPVALGGTDDLLNLALACRSCNGFKHAATRAHDPLSRRLLRLFNPRIDVWDEHFAVNKDSATIEGRTDVGRATVVRLRMNSRKHVEARHVWIVLFGFPDDPPAVSG